MSNIFVSQLNDQNNPEIISIESIDDQFVSASESYFGEQVKDKVEDKVKDCSESSSSNGSLDTSLCILKRNDIYHINMEYRFHWDSNNITSLLVWLSQLSEKDTVSFSCPCGVGTDSDSINGYYISSFFNFISMVEKFKFKSIFVIDNPIGNPFSFLIPFCHDIEVRDYGTIILCPLKDNINNKNKYYISLFSKYVFNKYLERNLITKDEYVNLMAGEMLVINKEQLILRLTSKE